MTDEKKAEEAREPLNNPYVNFIVSHQDGEGIVFLGHDGYNEMRMPITNRRAAELIAALSCALCHTMDKPS